MRCLNYTGGIMSKVLNHIKQLRRFEALSPKGKLKLVKELSKNKILTPAFANAKTAKNQGKGFDSYILHLAPASVSGFNVCPMASKGCKAVCLNTAGRGKFQTTQDARIRKTLFYIKARNEFLSKLVREIRLASSNAEEKGVKTVIRLNGTSDLSWEYTNFDGLNIFQLFPEVQFYDYTKVTPRLEKLRTMKLKNYYLTFSASESNWVDCLKALKLGFNVTVVFNKLPKTYKGYKVIDGDKDDLRFLDKGNGVIVGLKAKGDAKKDKSGFVKYVSDELENIA